MEKKIEPAAVPSGYALCTGLQCAAAEACPDFRLAATVTMARSFVGALRRVAHGSVGIVTSTLAHRYNLRTYYRMRKGEYALTPKQQKEVSLLLEAHGTPAPIVFDSYEEAYEWL